MLPFFLQSRPRWPTSVSIASRRSSLATSHGWSKYRPDSAAADMLSAKVRSLGVRLIRIDAHCIRPDRKLSIRHETGKTAATCTITATLLPTPVPQSPPPPPQQVASPPPPPQQVASPPPPSIANQVGLARSNTLAHAPAPPSNQGLARSNTIGTQQQQQYAPQQYHPQRQQYQQQHYHQQSQDQYRQSLIASAPVPPSAVLPSAPTAAPQFGSPYGVEQERKEALLIDL
ncbi:hypothetical protein NMY22_g9070 [Coprinellus aureogranulatus]|nr:hypothetical protein NMY22_g9070 [Coprinellus aureogranulatus]